MFLLLCEHLLSPVSPNLVLSFCFCQSPLCQPVVVSLREQWACYVQPSRENLLWGIWRDREELLWGMHELSSLLTSWASPLHSHLLLPLNYLCYWLPAVSLAPEFRLGQVLILFAFFTLCCCFFQAACPDSSLSGTGLNSLPATAMCSWGIQYISSLLSLTLIPWSEDSWSAVSPVFGAWKMLSNPWEWWRVWVESSRSLWIWGDIMHSGRKHLWCFFSNNSQNF